MSWALPYGELSALNARAPISFFAFILSSVGLLVVYFFPLIGCHDTFDLVLMTLNGNALFVKSAQFSR